MDWRDVGKVIAPLAPVAGSILGGLIPFPGGSLIGQKFGELIARQFGVDTTPQAVMNAVGMTPENVAIARINAAMAQARAEIDGFIAIEKANTEAITESVRQTGETMRAELVAERHWFFTGWRPACGWTIVVWANGFGFMLTYALWRAAFYDEVGSLQVIRDAWPAFLSFFGPLGLMVGVYIWARSEDKKVGQATDTTKTKPVVK